MRTDGGGVFNRHVGFFTIAPPPFTVHVFSLARCNEKSSESCQKLIKTFVGWPRLDAFDYNEGRVLLGLFRNRITPNRRIRFLLGAIPFWEWTEYQSVHFAPDSRMNERNTVYSEYAECAGVLFGKFLAGNPMRSSAPVAWLPVGRPSRSQVASAMSMNEPSSRILLEIEIPFILL